MLGWWWLGCEDAPGQSGEGQGHEGDSGEEGQGSGQGQDPVTLRWDDGTGSEEESQADDDCEDPGGDREEGQPDQPVRQQTACPESLRSETNSSGNAAFSEICSITCSHLSSNNTNGVLSLLLQSIPRLSGILHQSPQCICDQGSESAGNLRRDSRTPQAQPVPSSILCRAYRHIVGGSELQGDEDDPFMFANPDCLACSQGDSRGQIELVSSACSIHEQIDNYSLTASPDLTDLLATPAERQPTQEPLLGGFASLNHVVDQTTQVRECHLVPSVLEDGAG